jgi:hypothetical protein
MLIICPRVAITQLGRQNLHVAGEDHRVALDFVVDATDFGVGRLLVVGADGHVVERDAVPFDEGLEGVVIRDDARNLDVQFPGLPAGQQVVEAMLLFADHDHDAALHRRVADLPVHRQIFRERTEALAELGQVKRQRIGLHLHAHEIAAVVLAAAVVGVIA